MQIMNIHEIHWTGFSTGKSTGICTGFQLVNQLVIIYWFKSTGNLTGFQLVNQLVIIYWFSTGKSTGTHLLVFNW